jgi:hypothetical protein
MEDKEEEAPSDDEGSEISDDLPSSSKLSLVPLLVS